MPKYRVTEPFSYRIFQKRTKVFEADSPKRALMLAYDERRECGKDGWDDDDDDDYFLDDEAKREELEVEECGSDGQWIPYPGFARSDIDVNTVVADDGAERSDDGEDAIRSFFQDLLYGDEPMKR